MKSYLQKHWFSLAVSVILLAIIASFGYKFLHVGTAAADQRLEPIKPAPDFQFEDLNGKPVTLQDTNGKVRLFYFFYSSCPDVCQPTSFLLSQVQDELKKKALFGNQAQMFSVTIDPSRDTPDVLKEFSGRFHADYSGWSFLRGDEKKTADVAEKFGLMVVKDNSGNFTHSNAILLVDKKGTVRTFYDANDVNLDAKTIVKDVQTLAKEK
jgi:protein SCO1/2